MENKDNDDFLKAKRRVIEELTRIYSKRFPSGVYFELAVSFNNLDFTPIVGIKMNGKPVLSHQTEIDDDAESIIEKAVKSIEDHLKEASLIEKLSALHPDLNLSIVDETQIGGDIKKVLYINDMRIVTTWKKESQEDLSEFHNICIEDEILKCLNEHILEYLTILKQDQI